jgi:hypothetical protein
MSADIVNPLLDLMAGVENSNLRPIPFVFNFTSIEANKTFHINPQTRELLLSYMSNLLNQELREDPWGNMKETHVNFIICEILRNPEKALQVYDNYPETDILKTIIPIISQPKFRRIAVLLLFFLVTQFGLERLGINSIQAVNAQEDLVMWEIRCNEGAIYLPFDHRPEEEAKALCINGNNGMDPTDLPVGNAQGQPEGLPIENDLESPEEINFQVIDNLISNGAELSDGNIHAIKYEGERYSQYQGFVGHNYFEGSYTKFGKILPTLKINDIVRLTLNGEVYRGRVFHTEIIDNRNSDLLIVLNASPNHMFLKTCFDQNNDVVILLERIN